MTGPALANGPPATASLRRPPSPYTLVSTTATSSLVHDLMIILGLVASAIDCSFNPVIPFAPVAPLFPALPSIWGEFQLAHTCPGDVHPQCNQETPSISLSQYVSFVSSATGSELTTRARVLVQLSPFPLPTHSPTFAYRASFSPSRSTSGRRSSSRRRSGTSYRMWSRLCTRRCRSPS